MQVLPSLSKIPSWSFAWVEDNLQEGSFNDGHAATQAITGPMGTLTNWTGDTRSDPFEESVFSNRLYGAEPPKTFWPTCKNA